MEARADDEATLEEILLDALRGVLEPSLAEEALRRALASEHMPSLPAHPAALRFFVTGALRRVAVEELGAAHFDAVAAPLARRMVEAAAPRRAYGSGTQLRRVGDAPASRPPAPRVHRLVVVSLDGHVCDELERRVGAGVVVSRAESLFDFAPLLEMGPEGSGAVVVDAPASPIALPVLARMAHLIPPVCPVVVVGVRAADWERFVTLFPSAAEWEHAEDFVSFEPRVLLPERAPR
ncbi:MAG TPA: hypothetical protein RMH99_02525 [Sandaracinaceae bacterium LLY-WYZ-13_1]|nr:hypothetical protein [Sandaracinaceae bacterium LLY-WYZ-13_1]